MSADNRIGVCGFCDKAQTGCFYTGLPVDELRLIQDNQISANCPNFQELIREGLPVPVMVIPTDVQGITSLIIPDVPTIPTLAPTSTILPFESNSKKKKKETKSSEKKPKTSNVPMGFREYFGIPELMEAAGVPEHLWSPFERIAEAIDKTGYYPLDLTGAKRTALGERVTRIIFVNDVNENQREYKQFLFVLWSAVRTWTDNTKGKSREEIEPFVIKGS